MTLFLSLYASNTEITLDEVNGMQFSWLIN